MGNSQSHPHPRRRAQPKSSSHSLSHTCSHKSYFYGCNSLSTSRSASARQRPLGLAKITSFRTQTHTRRRRLLPRRLSRRKEPRLHMLCTTILQQRPNRMQMPGSAKRTHRRTPDVLGSLGHSRRHDSDFLSPNQLSPAETRTDTLLTR